jgi:hypothetical protein
VKDCKDERERRILAFLVPIFSPEKPYNITLTSCILQEEGGGLGKHH